ncbi:hypothetical protein, partial [Sansalvadorimonas verongulae]|uniref:hypothetical protein n=1 Tax=Sansalvadorimonas verongulae TaxID=2172824 RepID=UPI0018AD1C24
MAWCRTALIPLMLLMCAGQSLGESGSGTGMDQYQVGYLRDYMASQRFFDRLSHLADSPDYQAADIGTQVTMGEHAAQRAFSWILREYPLWTLATYGSFYTAVGALASPLASRLWNLYRFASKDVKLFSSMLGIVPVMLIVNPMMVLGGQVYYAMLPPSIPEALLIFQYGAKKNLLSRSTQNYIEDELFYSFWQSPSSEGLYRLRKILDKALRLPSYTKALTYDSSRIQDSLKNFSPELVERLDRFAFTEIMRQKMKMSPAGHYPVYFQGAPGTGK